MSTRAVVTALGAVEVKRHVVSIVDAHGRLLTQVDGVDGEPQAIGVQRLGWRALERAETEQQRKAIEVVVSLQAMSGTNTRDAIASAIEKATKDEAAAAPESPAEPAVPKPARAPGETALQLYDVATLVEAGVVTIDGSAKLPTKASDDWSRDVVEAVALAILRLSRPQLFESEADRKNG